LTLPEITFRKDRECVFAEYQMTTMIFGLKSELKLDNQLMSLIEEVFNYFKADPMASESFFRV